MNKFKLNIHYLIHPFQTHESFEALKVIVIALPDVNEKRARQEYLKTLQNYSMRVNGAKQVEILNLVGFTHEIDQIMTKYHGFKVGF